MGADLLIGFGEVLVLVEDALDVDFVLDFEAGYALDGHGGDVWLCGSWYGLEVGWNGKGYISRAALFRSSLLKGTLRYFLSGTSDMDGPPSSPTTCTYASEIVHDVLHSPGGVGEAWLLHPYARRWNASHTPRPFAHGEDIGSTTPPLHCSTHVTRSAVFDGNGKHVKQQQSPGLLAEAPLFRWSLR